MGEVTLETQDQVRLDEKLFNLMVKQELLYQTA